jgi:hypothetical protein
LSFAVKMVSLGLIVLLGIRTIAEAAYADIWAAMVV